LLDDESKIVSSRLGTDRFRVAGTAELNGYNRDIRDVRIDPLVAWTRHLFPSVSTERVIPWAGLRPMMPSMLPRVGRPPAGRVLQHRSRSSRLDLVGSDRANRRGGRAGVAVLDRCTAHGVARLDDGLRSSGSAGLALPARWRNKRD
jgi:hypothetical protein